MLAHDLHKWLVVLPLPLVNGISIESLAIIIGTQNKTLLNVVGAPQQFCPPSPLQLHNRSFAFGFAQWQLSESLANEWAPPAPLIDIRLAFAIDSSKLKIVKWQ